MIFTVPADAPTGCWVPVHVRTEGKVTSNVVTMAISTSGGSCAEPANPIGAFVTKGGKVAAILALRQTVNENINIQNPIEAVSDTVIGITAQIAPGAFPYHRIFSLPPAGSCTVLTAVGTLAGDVLTDRFGVTAKLLNAGTAWSLSQPANPGSPPVSITPLFRDGPLVGPAGARVQAIQTLPATLSMNPGSFRLTIPGGSDLGAMEANFTMPAMLNWTGRDALNIIDRAKPLALSWTGAPAGYGLFVVGGIVDMPTNSTAIFFCSVAPGASGFTIPESILSALPATQEYPSRSLAAVYVGAWNLANPASFTGTGLDLGALVSMVVSGKTVVFQ